MRKINMVIVALTLFLSMNLTACGVDEFWKFWEEDEAQADTIEMTREDHIKVILSNQEQMYHDIVGNDVDKRLENLGWYSSVNGWYDSEVEPKTLDVLKNLSDREIALLHALSRTNNIKSFINEDTIDDILVFENIAD